MTNGPFVGSFAEGQVTGRGCSTKDKVFYKECETHSYGEQVEKMCFCSYFLCNLSSALAPPSCLLLMIIGATWEQIPLIETAKRQGCYVLANLSDSTSVPASEPKLSAAGVASRLLPLGQADAYLRSRGRGQTPRAPETFAFCRKSIISAS